MQKIKIYTAELLFFAKIAQGFTVATRVVRHSATRQARPYVIVTLVQSGKDSALRSVLTRENGRFEIPAGRNTTYTLLVAAVGYGEKRLTATAATGSTDLGTIWLAVAAKQLGDVVVKAISVRPFRTGKGGCGLM